MLQFLKKTANQTYTENGALTYRTSGTACLDLFASIGALRQANEKEILDRFSRAFLEDQNLAIRILFYARDVRGGLGERRIFRLILRWLAQEHASVVKKNCMLIAEYGRYDDLLVLLGTPCEAAVVELIRRQLETDMTGLKQGLPVSLLAKWLPSVNASSKKTACLGKKLARLLGKTEVEYRKQLSQLRKQIQILENFLREQDYSFSYEKQPSKALYRYRKAFLRHDEQRYQSFLESVRTGAQHLHTDTLTPYDIVQPFFAGRMSETEQQIMDTTWKAQKNFTGFENGLVVVDGSGSMYSFDGRPAAVALSMGIYFAERNTGAYKNHFITFSEHPKLVEIQGDSIGQKLQYCSSFCECANTDIQKVFELILQTALQYQLPQKELPEVLYIISDMEFDQCTQNASVTNFMQAKQRYEACGYQLPQVVFWNVDSRNRQQPVEWNEQGVALVSGCSPQVFAALQHGIDSPYAYMLKVLGQERYARLSAG